VQIAGWWRLAPSLRAGAHRPDHFAVDRSPAPHAIRISLNAPASVEQLESGLQILKALIDSPPSAAMDP